MLISISSSHVLPLLYFSGNHLGIGSVYFLSVYIAVSSDFVIIGLSTLCLTVCIGLCRTLLDGLDLLVALVFLRTSYNLIPICTGYLFPAYFYFAIL